MREYINANDTIREDDYETITAAIALACEDGCRTVKIPRYNARTDSTVWSLMHAIQLPSDFTLILDNCYMEQALGSYDHLIENWRAHDTEWSNKPENAAHNIRVIGEGNVCLSGGEHNHLLEKTADHYGLGYIWWDQIMFWHNVNGLYVENVHFEHQRHWAVLHVFCQNIKYKNIDFFAYPHVPNMDGIDLRMGCHHVEIENLTGITGDDVFAMTDYMGVRELSLAVPGMEKDIHDVLVKNCKAASHNCYSCRILNQDGNKAYNVTFDTVMDSSDANSFRPGAGISIGSPYYFINYPAEPGDTYGITIKNVYTRGTQAVIINRVCKDTYIDNVHTFSNNLNFLYTMPDGMRMSNVVMEHLYYGSPQPLTSGGQVPTVEQYKGYFMNFKNVEGDMTLRHIEVDPIRIGFDITGGLDLKIEDLKMKECLVPFKHDEKSKITVDGEEK